MAGNTAIAAALVAALVAAASPAAAEPLLGAPEAPAFDFSWDTGTAKEQPSEYDKAMALGDGYALRAARWLERGSGRLIAERQSTAARAVAAYQKAAKAEPAEAEPHFRAAEVINAHFLKGGRAFAQAQARLAIHHWKEFQRLAPLDPRVATILFDRSLAYTKLSTHEDWELAIADYELLLKLRDPSRLLQANAATFLSNMAEMYMMVGRLDESIATFQRALALEVKPSHVLGLAVALDRHGQGAKAREITKLFLSERGFDSFIANLRTGQVFYVPSGEAHYYLALAHENFGLFSQAKAHYLDFVLSGAHPQFHARARINIANLAKRIEKTKKGRGKRGSRPARKR